MKESKFQNEQFKIAGVAENNSKFKTQNSVCAPSNVIPLSLFFPKAVVC